MISLHASYFGDNFGDSLFVIQYVEQLKKLGFKDSEIFLPFAGKRVRNYVKVSSIKGLKAMIISKKIIFIGGGYFGERKFQKSIWHIRFWIRHLSVAFLSIILRKKFIFLGVGAGPLSWKITKILTKYVINRSEGFYARDKKSYDFLKSYCDNSKIFMVTDSLISYSNHKNLNNKENSILIHLPLIKGMHQGVKPLLDIVYSIFKDNYKIIVANDFYKPSFNNTTYEIASKIFSDVEKIDYSDPLNFLKIINSCKLVFTVKLHVGILALACESKVFSVYVHEKTNRFYNQIGMSNVCFNYFDINKNLDEIKCVISDISQNKINYKIPKEVIEKSKHNLKVLKDFISDVKK